MTRLFLALTLPLMLALALGGPWAAEIKLGDSTLVAFASVEQGKKILTTRDDFVRGLSPFDRAARMKTDREISEETFLEFVGQSVLDWTDSEKKQVEAAFGGIQPRLQPFSLAFPETISMVKTTGSEEGGAAYTRGDAVVLPYSQLGAPAEHLQKLICHELFHILSRNNPQLRQRAYAAIGFEQCDEIEFPATFLSRKITNPDAPRNDHCIRLRVNGEAVWAVPILLSTTEKYDVARGGEFFNYLQFQLLLVERHGQSSQVKPLYDGPEPQRVDVEQVTGFFEQVGRNTRYIIHPEEILAENFALLVLGEGTVPSPEVLAKVRGAITGE